MYSLTNATELFVNNYLKWIWKEKSDLIKKYNAHKVRHTMWVLECWRMILIYMKQNWFYDEVLFNKAEMTFILHDIARFFQNDWEKILSISQFDHWYEWYNILKEIGEYDKWICLAIKYHDKYSIDWLFKDQEYIELTIKEKEDCVFLAKIIRDADKVQNMIYSIYNPEDYFFNLWVNIFDWKFSYENIWNLQWQILLGRDYINTKIDLVMSNFSRIFDINFQESFKFLQSFCYYEEIIKILKWLKWCDEELINICDKYIFPVYNKKSTN